uniref:Uncharacterized protein n=1 Tax=Triticum urartu TaxID=4572 RepID=A0A8R7R111_TRIUA
FPFLYTQSKIPFSLHLVGSSRPVLPRCHLRRRRERSAPLPRAASSRPASRHPALELAASDHLSIGFVLLRLDSVRHSRIHAGGAARSAASCLACRREQDDRENSLFIRSVGHAVALAHLAWEAVVVHLYVELEWSTCIRRSGRGRRVDGDGGSCARRRGGGPAARGEAGPAWQEVATRWSRMVVERCRSWRRRAARCSGA